VGLTSQQKKRTLLGNGQARNKVKVTLRPTISRSVHHGVEPHLGLMTRYCIQTRTQQWKELLSYTGSVPRPTQQWKCFIWGPIPGYITRRLRPFWLGGQWVRASVWIDGPGWGSGVTVSQWWQVRPWVKSVVAELSSELVSWVRQSEKGGSGPWLGGYGQSSWEETSETMSGSAGGPEPWRVETQPRGDSAVDHRLRSRCQPFVVVYCSEL
jgi:hypothetical protein